MIFHFIVINNFNYNELLGIYSAYVINSVEHIYVHYRNIENNENFNMLKRMKNIILIDLEDVTTDPIELKLDILYKWGGCILENNVLFYQNISNCINYAKDLIFFRDYEINSDVTNNISKYIIYGKRESVTIKQYRDIYLLSKSLTLPEAWHEKENIMLIQNKNTLLCVDSEVIDESCLLFYFKKSNYSRVQLYSSYKLIMKNFKHRMIVKTPKNDSLFYAVTDLLINSNVIRNNLDTDNSNIDVLSLQYSEVYTRAKNELKTRILEKISLGAQEEYDIYKIISVINNLYKMNLRMIKLHDCNEKIKITELKNIIINVIDDYYVTIK